LISKGAALIFKGHGFYITDYVKNKSPEVSQSGDKPSEKKTESAPAEKSADSAEKK